MGQNRLLTVPFFPCLAGEADSFGRSDLGLSVRPVRQMSGRRAEDNGALLFLYPHDLRSAWDKLCCTLDARSAAVVIEADVGSCMTGEVSSFASMPRFLL